MCIQEFKCKVVDFARVFFIHKSVSRTVALSQACALSGLSSCIDVDFQVWENMHSSFFLTLRPSYYKALKGSHYVHCPYGEHHAVSNAARILSQPLSLLIAIELVIALNRMTAVMTALRNRGDDQYPGPVALMLIQVVSAQDGLLTCRFHTSETLSTIHN